MSENQGTPAPVIDPVAVVAQATGEQPTGNPTETTPPPETAKDPKEESMASRFHALAKKQKMIDQAKRATEEREEALKAREARVKELEERLGQPKKKLSPIEALMEQGYTLAEANEFYLNKEMPTADHKIKEFETRLEQIERERKEKEEAKEAEEKAKVAQAHEEAITEFKSSIGSFIEKNSDTYELVKMYDPEGEAVFQTIAQYFEQNQKVLSIEEGSKLVEAYLEEELEKATKTKKYQSKYATQKEADKDLVPPGDKNALPAKTLSNALTTTPSGGLPPAMTNEERRQRAMRI